MLKINMAVCNSIIMNPLISEIIKKRGDIQTMKCDNYSLNVALLVCWKS